jgi:ubiquinone/menaquinone biosynthesis C-methylase UbiE
LDIGCGGGANIARMLKMASNLKAFGLDFSETSVAKSIKYNRKSIAKKQCEIRQGSVSHIPYDGAIFDVVSAFETTYFWPDIVNDTKEIFRVLKSGGTLFICNNEVSFSLDNDEKPQYFIKTLGMKVYTPKDFNNILMENGYIDIKINMSKNKKTFCVMAKKP